jgi:hypothetical protein
MAAEQVEFDRVCHALAALLRHQYLFGGKREERDDFDALVITAARLGSSNDLRLFPEAFRESLGTARVLTHQQGWSLLGTTMSGDGFVLRHPRFALDWIAIPRLDREPRFVGKNSARLEALWAEAIKVYQEWHSAAQGKLRALASACNRVSERTSNSQWSGDLANFIFDSIESGRHLQYLVQNRPNATKEFLKRVIPALPF